MPGQPYCLDCKPTGQRDYLWYAQRHLVAGFVNSVDNAFCNCYFVTIGDCVYIKAKYAMLAETELFVHYNDY